MEAKELYQEIQDLQQLIIPIAKRQPFAINKLAEVYYKVFKETFTVGCKSCPTKAFGKLQNISLQTLITMTNQKFKLKKEALINYPAFSGQHYSSHNITDEKAIEILTAYPSLIENFEKYPTKGDGSVDLELTDEETAEVKTDKVNIPEQKTEAKPEGDKVDAESDVKSDPEVKEEAKPEDTTDKK